MPRWQLRFPNWNIPIHFNQNERACCTINKMASILFVHMFPHKETILVSPNKRVLRVTPPTTPLLRRDAKNSPKRAEFFCCDFQSFTPPTAQIHCDPSQNWIICPRSEKLYYESGRKISTLRRNVRSIDHPNQSLNWLQRFLIR